MFHVLDYLEKLCSCLAFCFHGFASLYLRCIGNFYSESGQINKLSGGNLWNPCHWKYSEHNCARCEQPDYFEVDPAFSGHLD